MKIAFLNSSLEPGRDGIGDYVLSLAQECVRQGHDCCLIALNDRWISSSRRVTGTEGITQLRLPTTQVWSQRIRQASAVLDEFQAEWISLQFVPYGFQSKGFVVGLGNRLRPLTEGRRVQIMFHELWLGDSTTSPLRHRLGGVIQKYLIQKMVHQLAPLAIHTSNTTYATLLRFGGIAAIRLPLFGSVPIIQPPTNEWFYHELGQRGIEISHSNRSTFMLAGFFGSLPVEWPPEPLFGQLSAMAFQNRQRPALLSIGRLGAGERLWNDLQERYSDRFVFYKLGEQPSEHVSQYLNSLDFGIATTPYALIGKSSSAAAMLDHGLPVIVNRNDVQFKQIEGYFEDEPLLYKLGEDAKLSRFSPPSRQPTSPRLPQVAAKFVQDLASGGPMNKESVL